MDTQNYEQLKKENYKSKIREWTFNYRLKYPTPTDEKELNQYNKKFNYACDNDSELNKLRKELLQFKKFR